MNKSKTLQFYIDNLFQALVALVVPQLHVNGAVVARKRAAGDKTPNVWKRIEQVTVGALTKWYVEAGFKRAEDADKAFVSAVANLKYLANGSGKKGGRIGDDIIDAVNAAWQSIRPADFLEAAEFLLLTAKATQPKTLHTLAVTNAAGETFKFRISRTDKEKNLSAILACFAANVSVNVGDVSEPETETVEETPLMVANG